MRTMRIFLAASVMLIVVILTGWWMNGLPNIALAMPPVAQSPTGASEFNCPVTRAPNPSFLPPPPYPSAAPSPSEFWFGTGDFWTSLGNDGVWRSLPHNADGYTQKVFWWKPDYSGTVDKPDLTVTGKRLDGPAPALHTSKATNAYHPDFGQAMLVGIEVPTLGCWEITGHSADRELSYVVRVEP